MSWTFGSAPSALSAASTRGLRLDQLAALTNSVSLSAASLSSSSMASCTRPECSIISGRSSSAPAAMATECSVYSIMLAATVTRLEAHLRPVFSLCAMRMLPISVVAVRYASMLRGISIATTTSASLRRNGSWAMKLNMIDSNCLELRIAAHDGTAAGSVATRGLLPGAAPCNFETKTNDP